MNKYSVLTLVAAVVAYVYVSWDNVDLESLRDKRVLVTGASSGIGEQLAYRYATLGARLMLTARRLQLLNEVASRCRQIGAPQVEVFAADMAVAVDRDALMRDVEARLGGLDRLLLNHAVLRGGLWLGTAANFSDLQSDLTVSFVSLVDLASKALPMLERHGGGAVGVVSSGFGEVGIAFGSTYSANKHALHGFFQAWRQELRLRKVPVSVTICVLGPVATDNAKRIFSQFQLEDIYFFISSQEAAESIIEGVESKAYRIRIGSLIPFLLAVSDPLYYLRENIMHWFVFGSPVFS